MTKDERIDQYIFQIHEINNSDLPEQKKRELIEEIKKQMSCLN